MPPEASGDDRLRVLWLITGLGGGGAERLLVSSARVADHDRYRYEIARVLSWKDALVGELGDLGVEVHDLGVRDVRDPRWVVRLRRLLARRGCDVLHAHSPFPAGVARLVTRTLPEASRPHLATTEHNIWTSYSLPTRMLGLLTLGLDDARLAVSQAVCSSLPDSARPSTEIVVQGLLLKEVRGKAASPGEVRAEFGIDEGELIAVTVANLRPTKAHDDLLRAARHVRDAGVPVTFLAVGGGPLEDRLKRQKADLGLGDHFRFVGYRADALRILSAADLFVLSSVFEGYPIALMEALALGVPVVATSVGGTTVAVTPGVEGLLVPPAQPDRLAEAIIELAEDPDRRQRFAAAAWRRGEDFDIRDSVTRTEKIYSDLTSTD